MTSMGISYIIPSSEKDDSIANTRPFRSPYQPDESDIATPRCVLKTLGGGITDNHVLSDWLNFTLSHIQWQPDSLTRPSFCRRHDPQTRLQTPERKDASERYDFNSHEKPCSLSKR